MDQIIFLTTGGTIEKTYDEFDGSLLNRKSIVEQMIINRLRLPTMEISLFHVLATDSLDMTQEDRDILLFNIKNFQKKNCPIIILHGTDNMAHSAEFIKKNLTEIKYPIIFTGAMKPVGFSGSDAYQNVIEALNSTRFLKPDVYISFHGQSFVAGTARKNKRRGTFEAI